MKIAASIPESHDLYRRQVALEVKSTFAFQGSKWLGDVAPQLLTRELAGGLAEAKEKAAERVLLEKQIPRDLLFVKGKPWPSRAPTAAEAGRLAEIRGRISSMLGIQSMYLDAGSVQEHYDGLMTLQAEHRAAA